MERISRRVATAILAGITVTGLVLSLWGMRVGLPRVFHSDYIQIDEAKELLVRGSFTERSSYPVTHVYVYAAADCITFALGMAKGALGFDAPWESWEGFLNALTQPTLRHSIGRAYTAIVGSLLAIAVYRLARVRFGRATALLAAAIAAFAPVHVIYAHQVRIHVPAITLLAASAVPVVRLGVGPTTVRRAIFAGAACGLVAGIFQLGYLLLATAGALCAFARTGFRSTVRTGLAVLLGFAALLLPLVAVTHLPGVVRAVAGSGLFDQLWTLGIPSTAVKPHLFENLPGLVFNWVLAEPVRAVAVLLFLAVAVRDREARRDAVLFGAYPAIAFLALGTNYTEPRYSLSVTPFLAVLAAAAATRLKRPLLAAGPAALLVLSPLLASIRYDALIGWADTRDVLKRILPLLGNRCGPVMVETALITGLGSLPGGVDQFPPGGAYQPWIRGETTPFRTLSEHSPSLFISDASSPPTWSVEPRNLDRLGYVLTAEIPSGITGETSLPDAPNSVWLDLWKAERPGPTIALRALTERAREQLVDIAASRSALLRLTLRPNR